MLVICLTSHFLLNSWIPFTARRFTRFQSIHFSVTNFCSAVFLTRNQIRNSHSLYGLPRIMQNSPIFLKFDMGTFFYLLTVILYERRVLKSLWNFLYFLNIPADLKFYPFLNEENFKSEKILHSRPQGPWLPFHKILQFSQHFALFSTDFCFHHFFGWKYSLNYNKFKKILIFFQDSDTQSFPHTIEFVIVIPCTPFPKFRKTRANF